MDDERFGRLAALIGEKGVARLARARVVVFGLGGVGAACAEALARGNVGSLVLIDGDTIEQSNINRQLFALDSTVGREKAQVAAERIRDINPYCSIEFLPRFVMPKDAADLLDALHTQAPTDYIADCIDTPGTKIALVEWAAEHDVPYIGAAGTARKRNALAFEFADIFDTQVCPLCRVLRKEARKRGIPRGRMEMLYSREAPASRVPSGEMPVGEAPADTMPFHAHSASAEDHEASPCNSLQHPTSSGNAHLADERQRHTAPNNLHPEVASSVSSAPSADAPMITHAPAPLGTMPHVPPIAGMLIAGRILDSLINGHTE